MQTHNISSTITNMFPLTRSKGKLHQDGDGPTHDHNENTEGNNMNRMRLELSTLSFRIFLVDKC